MTAKKTTTKKVKEVATKEIQKVDEVEVVKNKISGMQEMLATTKVTNEDELAKVSDKVKAVKMLKKFIEEQKDKLVAPAKAIINEARLKYDPYIKECENAEATLKSRAGKFLDEQEKAKIEKEEKLAKRVENGTMKEETAVKKMEELKEVPKTVNTGTSALRRTKRRVVEITDLNLIPDEYWIVDEVRVRKEGLVKEIPGTIVKEETVMSSM